MPPPRATVPGDVYGKLVVLREARPSGGHRRVWCRCDCGAEVIVRADVLRRGRTRSCRYLTRGAHPTA